MKSERQGIALLDVPKRSKMCFVKDIEPEATGPEYEQARWHSTGLPHDLEDYILLDDCLCENIAGDSPLFNRQSVVRLHVLRCSWLRRLKAIAQASSDRRRMMEETGLTQLLGLHTGPEVFKFPPKIGQVRRNLTH